jgi:23S rRNA (cytidine1920-2'-O)/16S rRNA (cytidine1409-2'-O)-methyltransferase
VKRRADLLLVERGLAPSRAKAQALLLAGSVYSGEIRIAKPGTELDAGAPLSVRAPARFVSRGGDKLDGALAALAARGVAVDVTGEVAVDIGASTGGFTDCLLQRGAAKVYAVDVGHGQVAAKLRDDSRVVVRERTNARELQASDFAEPIDLVVVDASFIGLGKLLPAIARVLRTGGRLIALVKPQFEAGRDEARRARGVIRDPAVREAAIERVRQELAGGGFELLAEQDSPVPGPKGNVERFLVARRRQSTSTQMS